MASLTIGGQVRELRLTAQDLQDAEDQILKRGGRRVLEMFLRDSGMLSMSECRWLLWGAWHRTLPDDRIGALVEQFYAEGGTVPELHTVLLEVMIDSGLIVKRGSANGAGPPADPPQAGTAG